MTRRTICRGFDVLRRAVNAVFTRSENLRSRWREIDSLEPRRLFAVFNGTAGADEIEITIQAGGAQSIISINGVNNFTPDTSITINAGGGNDTFEVFTVRNGITLLARGDGGNDTLINVGTSLDLDSDYLGALTFEGGSGFDTVVADNTTDTASGYEMAFSATNILKSTSFDPILEFSTIEALEYRDNDQGNLLQVRGMQLSTISADVQLSIIANGGNDTIFNGTDTATSNGSWDSAIGTGGLFVNAGAGNDTMLLSNTGNEGTETYTFNSNTISGFDNTTATGTVTYSAVENLDFVCSGDTSGSAFANTVRLFSKPSTTALRVDGRGGNDTFTVGNNDFDDSGLLLSNTTIIGGSGNDSYTVQDQADADSGGGEFENYSWNANTLIKGTAGINFFEFESQSLVAANGIIPGQFATTPRVDINVTPTSMASTTVVGGSSRMCRVDVGTGNVSANINGTLFLQLSGQLFDQINVNNTVATGDILFRHTQNQLVLPRVINYSGAMTVNLNMGSGNDNVFIDGVGIGTTLTVNGNNGNDNVTLGGGNLSTSLLGPVIVNGGAGTNIGVVDNTSDAAVATQSMTGATFVDGQSHTFSALASLNINGGPGGSNLTVNSTVFKTDILGNSGNDNYIVGGGDVDANIPAGAAITLTVNGQGGTDSLVIDDRNDTSLSGFRNFRRNGLFDEFFEDNTTDHFIDWTGMEGTTFEASNAEFAGGGNSADFISVLDIASQLTINGNGGPDSIQVQDAAFPVIIDTGAGANDSIFLNSDLDAIPGAAIIQHSDAVRDLGIFAGGTLRVTSGAVLNKTGTLPGNLSINGVLDLAGGALLCAPGTPLTTFQTQLTRGHNGDAWNGNGAGGAINSSLAASSTISDGVGYGLGSEIVVTSIGGFTVAPDDILIRYTLNGDADLNGTVNISDFARLAVNFNGANKIWTTADSNYDGVANISDFSSLAANFNQSIPVGLPRNGLLTALAGRFSNRLIDSLEL